MTVKELIDELLEYPQDSTIKVSYDGEDHDIDGSFKDNDNTILTIE